MYLDVDEQFMDLALAEAKKAEASGEVPVGAVIVSDGIVIAKSFNRPLSLNDPTAHAEIGALRDACREQGNYRLSKATMYSTVEPCMMCAGAMIHARLARLVFRTPDPKAGTCQARVNHCAGAHRSEEHTSELQSPCNLVCRLLLEKK